MAAINVTTSTGDTMALTNHNEVTTSSGIRYIAILNTTDNTVEVWKANAVTPSSYSIIATLTGGTGTKGGVSADIDSTDIIHISWHTSNSGMTNDAVRYATVDTSDDSSSEASISFLDGNHPTAGNQGTSIKVDANDIPHVLVVDLISNMGSDYYTVYYSNRIGGSWKTIVEVEGETAQVNCIYPDLAIDADNLPVASYINTTDATISAAQGNANDATAFSLFDVDSYTNQVANASIAVTASGDHQVAYATTVGASNYDLKIREHLYIDTWTSTWQTVETITTSGISNTTNKLGLVTDGDDRYVFCIDQNADTHYYYDTGSGWTDGGSLDTGTYQNALPRWGYWVNNDSSGKIVVDQYGFSNRDVGTPIYSTTYSGVAQSITGAGTALKHVVLYLLKSGSPTGNLTVNLYAHSGTFGTSSVPTGSALASTGTVAESSLSTSWEPYLFTFSSPYTLTDGTKYCIAVETTNTDSGNYVLVGGDNSSPGHDGNWSRKESGTWTANSGFDVVFVAYASTSEMDYVFTDGTDVLWNTLSLGTGATTMDVSDTITITDSPTVFIPTLTVSVSDSITVTDTFTNTYYFDGSDATATDPDTAWTNDDNAFDGDGSTTYATTSAVGSTSSNYLLAEGTNAPTPIGNITQVRLRVTTGAVGGILRATAYTDALAESLGEALSSAGTGSWVTLSDPSGGWDSATVQALETKVYATTVDTVVRAYIVEIEVTTAPQLVSPVGNPDVNVNDTITITEDSTVRLTSYVDVNDTITITESTPVSPNSFVDVNDTITITENVSLSLGSSIDVFDSVTVSESVSVLISQLVPSVFDTVTITENTTLSLSSYVDVNDIITITESVEGSLTSYPSVSDDLTITESVAVLIPLSMNVNDSVTVSEDVTPIITSYIDSFDAVTLTEGVTILINELVPSASETLTVTESVAVSLTSYIDVNDTITTTESVSLVLPVSMNVFDGVTITESVDVRINIFVSASDDLTITESSTPSLTSYVDVFDTLTITESSTVGIGAVAGASVDVGDDITITENVSVDIKSYVNVNDTVTITEFTDERLTSYVDVSDTLTVTESVSATIGTVAAASIDVFDTLTITESVSVDIKTYVDVNDTVTITESITERLASFVDTFDSVTITDASTVLEISNISVSDSLTITEAITIDVNGFVDTSDDITITESVSVTIPTMYIDTSDILTITDSSSVSVTGGAGPAIELTPDPTNFTIGVKIF